MQKLSKQLNKLREWWHIKSVDRLLGESGVNISPEPDVWGVLNKTEEDIVLANLYENKLWLALMKKYAEGANKAMIQAVRLEQHGQALRQNAIFFSYNNIIIRARRAKIRLDEKEKGSNN